MTVYGWDISNHDWDRAHAAGRTVDLANARKAGIAFATHKATEGCPAAGNAYQDPYFDDYARQLASVAFPVAGSYHATHRGHPLAQADFWFDTVSAKYPWRKHPCWIWQIDAEPLDGYPAPTKADILAIGARIQQRAGVPASQVVVYGPDWVYGDTLTGIPYRLWASNYADRDRSFTALYPGDAASHWAAYSGQTPLILQYSSGATIGAQHTCDANAVRVRDEAALQALFLGHPQGGSPLSDLTPAQLDQIAAAVWNWDHLKIGDDPKNPTWAASSALTWVTNSISAIRQDAAKIGAVAAVVNDTAPRVAAVQAALDKLGQAVAALEPAAQVALDVAGVAAATADAVVAKLRAMVWGVK
jgi:hypothetical protein